MLSSAVRRGKRVGRGVSMALRLCAVCGANPRAGNNPYCKDDKKEYEALKKDCIAQGKEEVLDKALQDMVLFRKILQDYREQCQPQRNSKGRCRPPYDFTRVSELERRSTVVRRGGASDMKD